MPRLSAVDCFRPALERTKALLFRPFRFGFWCRMALLGVLTGELSAGGGCNFNYNGGFPSTGDGGRSRNFLALDPVWERIAHYWWLIALAAAVLFVLFVVFMYLASVARFILFEAVLVADTRLRAGWRRWRISARSYFQFQLGLFVCTWGALLIVVGLPLFLAYRAGFFSNFSQHLLIGALGITALVGLTLLLFAAVLIIHVLVKDFVVPIMALDELSFGPAARRFASILRNEKGGFAGYIGFKVLLTIGAGLAFGIGSLLVMLVLLVPIVIVAAIVIAIGAASGLTWTPMTIALAVALGINAVAGITILITFLHTPLAAFFPSYSILFFAGHYAPLHERLYPAAAPPAAPPQTEPGPDLPPTPSLG